MAPAIVSDRGLGERVGWVEDASRTERGARNGLIWAWLGAPWAELTATVQGVARGQTSALGRV